jgi:tetratricopeptide (TPR) repeat protein
MRRRILGKGAAVSLAAVSIAALTCALTVRRIPESSVGLSVEGRVSPPGWTLSLPWRRLRILPVSGRLALHDVEIATREGAALRYEVEADYRLGVRLAPRLATDIRRIGLDGAATTLATEVLREDSRNRDAETLAADSTILEEPLRVAFATAGLAVAQLRVRSPFGDEVIRRRKTGEAQGLVRPMKGRLLLIGLDGADWELLLPMIRAGRLPNLARLFREGAHGDLRSYDPMFSPMLWTTVATGKSPDKHGIADFLVKDPASGLRRPITSDFRKVKALWNILTDFHRPSGWVSWWASYPAEPLEGVMITELLAHTMVRGSVDDAASRPSLTWPRDYLASRKSLLVPPSNVRYEDARRLFPLTEAEFEDAQARAPVEPPPSDTSKEPPDPLTFTVKMLAAEETYGNLAVDLLRQDLPVVSVYFEGIDMVGHRFQHYLPPKMAMVTDAEFERFRGAVPAFYEMQDEMIGRLLEAAGPGTTTMVVSDHGFRHGDDRPTNVPPYTTGQPEEWHRPWGIVLLHGPGIRAIDLPPASIYDVMPTLLYLAGLPLADDMTGRLISDALDPSLLAAAPPRRIRSYELVGQAPERRESAPVDADSMSEMMANLRALGYVGGGEASAPPAQTASGPVKGEAAETQVFYHRNLATYYMKQGNLEAAESELVAANGIKKLSKTYAMLGQVRAERGRFLDAASAIEEGLREIPEQMSPDSVLWMVEMLLKADRPAEAADAASRYDAKLKPAPRFAIQGRLAEARGGLPAAQSLYERALGEDPSLVDAAVRLYGIYRDGGTPSRIEPILLRGLAAAPRSDVYHNLLGELCLARGDYTCASARFKAAVDVEPENGVYLGNLAVAEAALGNRREARATVDWFLRWQPRDPQGWLSIGSALDRLHDPARAIQAFRRARELGAQGPAADVGEILVLARSGRSDEAHSLLADARGRFPSSQLLRDLSRRLGG